VKVSLLRSNFDGSLSDILVNVKREGIPLKLEKDILHLTLTRFVDYKQ